MISHGDSGFFAYSQRPKYFSELRARRSFTSLQWDFGSVGHKLNQISPLVTMSVAFPLLCNLPFDLRILYEVNWKEGGRTQWLSTIAFILQGEKLKHKGSSSVI